MSNEGGQNGTRSQLQDDHGDVLDVEVRRMYAALVSRQERDFRSTMDVTLGDDASMKHIARVTSTGVHNFLPEPTSLSGPTGLVADSYDERILSRKTIPAGVKPGAYRRSLVVGGRSTMTSVPTAHASSAELRCANEWEGTASAARLHEVTRPPPVADLIRARRELERVLEHEASSDGRTSAPLRHQRDAEKEDSITAMARMLLGEPLKSGRGGDARPMTDEELMKLQQEVDQGVRRRPDSRNGRRSEGMTRRRAHRRPSSGRDSSGSGSQYGEHGYRRGRSNTRGRQTSNSDGVGTVSVELSLRLSRLQEELGRGGEGRVDWGRRPKPVVKGTWQGGRMRKGGGRGRRREGPSPLQARKDRWAAAKAQAAWEAAVHLEQRELAGVTAVEGARQEQEAPIQADLDHAQRLLREQDEAAVRIQSGVRGRLARKHVSSVKQSRREEEAAVRIQSGVRGRLARRQVELLKQRREEKAAVRIQSGVRGRLARKHVSSMKQSRREEEAAVRIQSGVRGRLARKHVGSVQQSRREADADSQMRHTRMATSIQSFYRGRRTEKQLMATRQGHMRVEAKLRSVAAIARAAVAEGDVDLITAAAANGWLLRTRLALLKRQAWEQAEAEAEAARHRQATAAVKQAVGGAGEDDEAVASDIARVRAAERMGEERRNASKGRARRASAIIYGSGSNPLVSIDGDGQQHTLDADELDDRSNSAKSAAPRPDAASASSSGTRAAPFPLSIAATSRQSEGKHLSGVDGVAEAVGEVQQSLAQEERQQRGHTLVTFGLGGGRLLRAPTLEGRRMQRQLHEQASNGSSEWGSGAYKGDGASAPRSEDAEFVGGTGAVRLAAQMCPSLLAQARIVAVIRAERLAQREELAVSVILRFMRMAKWRRKDTRRRRAMESQGGETPVSPSTTARRRRKPRGKRNSLVSLATSVMTNSAPVITDAVLQWARQRVTSIQPAEIKALAKPKAPHGVITTVAGALCVLLHMPNPTWKVARKLMKRSRFLEDLANVNPEQVSAFDKRVARKLLLSAADDLSAVRQAAPVLEARASTAAAMKDAESLLATLKDTGLPPASLTEDDDGATSLHILTPGATREEAGTSPDPDRAMRCLIDWITIFAKWRVDDRDDDDEDTSSQRGRDDEAIDFPRSPTKSTASSPVSGAGGTPGRRGRRASATGLDDLADFAAASPASSVVSEYGVRSPVLPLEQTRASLKALPAHELTALVAEAAPSLASLMAMACVCVIAGSPPSWDSACTLLSDTNAEATKEKLAAMTREDVANKARLLLATMLAARRLTALTPTKEEAMGSTLATLYRWIISILSIEGMPLRKIPQPRSARRSAARFVAALLQGTVEEDERAATQSLVRQGHGSTVGGEGEGDGESSSAAVEASRLQQAVGALSTYSRHGRESVAMLVLRASLRASAWRAKARVRRWQELGVLRLLGGTPLGRARRGLLDLTIRDVNQFRRQKPPPRETLAVASAMCVVLCERASWKFCRRVLEQGSVLEFLCELSPGHIGDEALAEARELLHTAGPEGTSIAEAVRQSPLRATKALHRWMLCLTDPDGEELRDFKARAGGTGASDTPATDQ